MRWFAVLLVCFAGLPRSAQSKDTLQPQTVALFDAYARNVEATLKQRWAGKLSLLSLDEHPDARAAVLRGNLWIESGSPQSPIPVQDGLIHDWIGAVFIPNIEMAKVVAILQDFDHHSQIYPEVKRSHLISRKDGDIKGYWRLVRTQSVVTAVLDVTQEAHWMELAPGKVICRAYTRDISEVEHADTPEEEILPPGQGRGYMWRLYAYWSLKSVNGGVLAECRTASLSNDIPAMLSWIIKPFVQSLPRDSLAGTLEHTRDAAEKAL